MDDFFNSNLFVAIIGGLVASVIAPFFTKSLELEKIKFGLIKTKQYDILQDLYGDILELYFSKEIDTGSYPDFSKYTEEDLRRYLEEYKCADSWADEIVKDFLGNNKRTKEIFKFIKRMRLYEASQYFYSANKNFQKSEICIEKKLAGEIKILLSDMHDYILQFEDFGDQKGRGDLYRRIKNNLNEIKNKLRNELTHYQKSWWEFWK